MKQSYVYSVISDCAGRYISIFFPRTKYLHFIRSIYDFYCILDYTYILVEWKSNVGQELITFRGLRHRCFVHTKDPHIYTAPRPNVKESSQETTSQRDSRQLLDLEAHCTPISCVRVERFVESTLGTRLDLIRWILERFSGGPRRISRLSRNTLRPDCRRFSVWSSTWNQGWWRKNARVLLRVCHTSRVKRRRRRRVGVGKCTQETHGTPSISQRTRETERNLRQTADVTYVPLHFLSRNFSLYFRPDIARVESWFQFPALFKSMSITTRPATIWHFDFTDKKSISSSETVIQQYLISFSKVAVISCPVYSRPFHFVNPTKFPEFPRPVLLNFAK